MSVCSVLHYEAGDVIDYYPHMINTQHDSSMAAQQGHIYWDLHDSHNNIFNCLYCYLEYKKPNKHFNVSNKSSAFVRGQILLLEVVRRATICLPLFCIIGSDQFYRGHDSAAEDRAVK